MNNNPATWQSDQVGIWAQCLPYSNLMQPKTLVLLDGKHLLEFFFLFCVANCTCVLQRSLSVTRTQELYCVQLLLNIYHPVKVWLTTSLGRNTSRLCSACVSSWTAANFFSLLHYQAFLPFSSRVCRTTRLLWKNMCPISLIWYCYISVK